jgi:hypothetical protein
MHTVIELLGWFVFNVAIPLFAPLALLPLLLVADPHPERHAGIVRFAVKDGQLLWAVIPMSASACHMLASALDEVAMHRQFLWVAMLAHVMVIVAACVTVMFATAAAYQRDRFLVARADAGSHTLRYCVALSAISGTMHFLGYTMLIRPSTFS